MPFIHNIRRQDIDKNGPKACIDVGDICYVFYKHLVSIWFYEPRWRTIHRVYKDLIRLRHDDAFYALMCTELANTFDIDDIDTALDLAWIEFYRNFAAPYENEKRKTNGDIL